MKTQSISKVLLLLLAAAGLSAPASAQTSPIDPAVAATYFAEAAALVAADSGRLWNARLDGPIMLVDPATRHMVTNVPDRGGVVQPAGRVFAGTLPKSLNAANTAVSFDGTLWTMLLWPPGETPYERRRMFAHELFHRLQHEAGWKTVDASNNHLATESGRTWMRLELRALAAAVTGTGRERDRAIRDALAFRAERRALHPDASAQERMLEAAEGTAEYTGYRLSGLSERQIADSIAAHLMRLERSASFARSFAYGTGPAYGILLDAAHVRWRARGDQIDLSGMLRDAAGAESNPASARARAARYGGTAVLTAEAERSVRQAARLKALRATFIDGPVLKVLPGAAFSMSFDPNQAEPLEPAGTVYPSTRISDVWGVLTVESGGALFLSPEPGMYTGVAVPLPSPAGERPPLAGPGWKLELAAGWVVRRDVRTGDWVVAKAP